MNALKIGDLEIKIPIIQGGMGIGISMSKLASAVAENGKTQVRPLVAPEGFWSFEVDGDPLSSIEAPTFELNEVYPNPAVDLVSIPIYTERAAEITVYLTDITGKVVRQVYAGSVRGDRRLSVFVNDLAPGVYQVVVENGSLRRATPLLVK